MASFVEEGQLGFISNAQPNKLVRNSACCNRLQEPTVTTCPRCERHKSSTSVPGQIVPWLSFAPAPLKPIRTWTENGSAFRNADEQMLEVVFSAVR